MYGPVAWDPDNQLGNVIPFPTHSRLAITDAAEEFGRFACICSATHFPVGGLRRASVDAQAVMLCDWETHVSSCVAASGGPVEHVPPDAIGS